MAKKKNPTPPITFRASNPEDFARLEADFDDEMMPIQPDYDTDAHPYVPPIRLGNSENIFVQSNDLIQARYKDTISFWEHLILSRMCTMISPYDTGFSEYRIYIKDLIEFSEVGKNGQLYDRIVNAATKLRRREISVHLKDEKGQDWVLDTYIVTGVEVPVKGKNADNVHIKLTFHPKLKPFLLQIKRDFTKFDIRNYRFLHSGTVTRMYQLLKSYHDRRQRELRLDLTDLKEMLGVADKYSLYANFRIKVLDEAQKRFMKGADIRFEYTEEKIGNKVVAIKFKIRTNEEAATFAAQPLNVAPDTDEDLYAQVRATVDMSAQTALFEQLFPLVKYLGVSAKGFAALLNVHSEAEILNALKVTETAMAAGKIKASAAGFFVEAVRAGFKTSLNDGSVDKTVKTKAVAAPDAADLARQRKLDARREQFERERTEILERLRTDGDLRERVIQQVRQGVFGMFWNENKTFEENLANDAFFGAVYNTVKKM
jgi:plasmid replication initiation protein